MIPTNVKEEYLNAQRAGLKEKKDRLAAGLDPYPAVLDEILPEGLGNVVELPVQEIPVERIVGMRSAARSISFSAGFMPLLDADSEFGAKWISLCKAHLSDEGIRDAIVCYEYLGDFYVQEGNKRLSVLKHFGAVRIFSQVRRVLPAESSEPRIRAYHEFLDFYKNARFYDVMYHKPGDYAKLLTALGKAPDEPWTDEERKRFLSNFHHFKTAFEDLGGPKKGLIPEEALLLWLQIHRYTELTKMPAKELKASLSALWGDVQAAAEPDAIALQTAPKEEKKNIIEKLVVTLPKKLNVAFVYRFEPEWSTWTQGHEEGARAMAEVFGEQVTVRHYYHADSPEQADALLKTAVEEGAELVFTTSPQLLRPTLKAAVQAPKVRFLNCSANQALSSVRSYYCRTFEGKFITGLIAGALAENDVIGYVGTYPIYGVPASINAFALGARMSNPRVKVLLEWNCLPGSPTEVFREQGVRVISNRDIPVQNPTYMAGGRYGTYLIDADGTSKPLASPCWLWSKLYENVVREVLSGNWGKAKDAAEAVNYWWGMSSGAIDVELTDLVPPGVAALARMLMDQLRAGTLDPFKQRIVTQDGRLINDGSRSFSAMELLQMDWLCDHVIGRIPAFEELLPKAKPLVRELGVHRESLPPKVEEEE